MLRSRFGRGVGPVVRRTTKWMRWRRLFPLTEDMDNPFLITGLRPTCLSTTVFSAFRSIGLTELPFTNDNIFAFWFKRWNRWKVASKFFLPSGAVTEAELSLYNVPFAVRWMRVKFYLPVTAWWVKTLAELCWSPPAGRTSSFYPEPVALICTSSP
jgi:hypothetical protein